jgi:hypothetical protein
VLAPHRGCRIVLERRFVIDGWSTLVLRARLSDQQSAAEGSGARLRRW